MKTRQKSVIGLLVCGVIGVIALLLHGIYQLTVESLQAPRGQQVMTSVSLLIEDHKSLN